MRVLITAITYPVIYVCMLLSFYCWCLYRPCQLSVPTCHISRFILRWVDTPTLLSAYHHSGLNRSTAAAHRIIHRVQGGMSRGVCNVDDVNVLALRRLFHSRRTVVAQRLELLSAETHVGVYVLACCSYHVCVVWFVEFVSEECMLISSFRCMSSLKFYLWRSLTSVSVVFEQQVHSVTHCVFVSFPSQLGMEARKLCVTERACCFDMTHNYQTARGNGPKSNLWCCVIWL